MNETRNEYDESYNEFVEELRHRYRQEGYDELNPRYVHEQISMQFQPDLVLKRGDEVHVFEIKKPAPATQGNTLRQIKKEIESHPGWHFHFLVIPTRVAPKTDNDALEEANSSFQFSRKLYEESPLIASVTLWIALETAMRHLLTMRGERPSYGTSGIALARRLRDLGELDDDEMRLIARGFEARNRAAHGYSVPPELVPQQTLYALAEELLRRAGLEQKDGVATSAHS
jgi:hypothetical protein